jgi:hypothetical protein
MVGVVSALSCSLGGGSATAAPERKLTIFYAAEVHGTPEPCGCTSDPLGDVARYAALVRTTARSGPVLVVDAGGLSFPETSTPKEKEANAARARFLAKALGGMGPPFAAGLGSSVRAPSRAGFEGPRRPMAASRSPKARSFTLSGLAAPPGFASAGPGFSPAAGRFNASSMAKSAAAAGSCALLELAIECLLQTLSRGAKALREYTREPPRRNR